jgi:hypothetical protein
MAKMARFYGWTKNEIDDLDIDDFYKFSHSINRLENAEHMMRLKEADWVNMKDGERKKHWKQVYKLAYPDLSNKPGRTLSTKELFEILSNR